MNGESSESFSNKSFQMVPTSVKAEEQANLMTRILNLPLETQVEILKDMSKDDLINMCLVNRELLELCLSSYLEELLLWDWETKVIFQLTVLSKCDESICAEFHKQLEDELTSNPVFMDNYNNLMGLIYSINPDPFGNDMVNRLISTKELHLEEGFEDSVDMRYFVTLEKLTFDYTYDFPIDKEIDTFQCKRRISLLPDSLITLIFDNQFNEDVEYIINEKYKTLLPPKLRNLKFGDDFEGTVNSLPQTLRNLRLGYQFDNSIDNLPKNLKTLHLGELFKHNIDKLPTGLSKLTLSSNIPVDNLPNRITDVIFENNFNQSINKLPNSVRSILLGEKYNKPINKLPASLQYLTILKDYTDRYNIYDIALLVNVTLYYEDRDRVIRFESYIAYD